MEVKTIMIKKLFSKIIECFSKVLDFENTLKLKNKAYQRHL